VEAKRRELSQILNVEVPANSKAIGEAADLGDLRENAEYHAAKDRQKLLMQRATELEDLISRARVVDLDKVTPDVVRFGTRVTLRNHRTGRDETYTLLGLWEADAPNGIISYMTPFGSQLINRKPGESFDVSLPDGSTVGYSVTSVEKSV
jgi:transcription elongation factor GreA